MIENEIETALRQKVEAAGGLCKKWVCPGWSGAPDRIVIFPDGLICFVETKRPGEKPRPLQVRRIAVLRKLGCLVFVIDTLEGIRDFIDFAKGRMQ